MKLNSKNLSRFSALFAAGMVCASSQAAVVVANNVSPGDSFTNAGGSNQGQAVGASGWFYNNVRNSGSAGIDSAYARSGNGSAHLSGSVGPGGASSKADIEFLAGGVNAGGTGAFRATSTLGLFKDFSGMQYDWYRNITSTTSGVQHPALRILLDLDGNLSTIGDRGGLVFELVYNGGGTVPTNVWTTSTVTSSTNVWNFGLGLGNLFDLSPLDGYAFDNNLAAWQSYAPAANAVILGFSAGIGSGWGAFDGAVDNIGWTIGGQTSTYNFEVAPRVSVPEPGTLALVAAALLGCAGLRRRQA